MARRIIIALSIIIGMGIVLFVNWPGVIRPPAIPEATSPSTEAAKAPNIGGTFALTDTSGNAVTEAALLGHYSLVFFGFTHCPDICPVTLQKMTQAIEGAGGAGEKVLPVFITVDPEHDTSEVMKAYVANFHPRFLALTGTPEALKQAADAYRVYARKSDTGVVHTDIIYLMDPTGKFMTKFDGKASAADITDALQRAANQP
jgi:protein SCO1/2